MENTETILKIENVTVTYNSIPTIKDISLDLKKGELISLLGVSGVGKTTLFNVIAGLIKPDSGNVYMQLGDEYKNITNTSGNVSYMLQKDMLFPYKTIIDNVSLPLRIKGMKRKSAYEIALTHMKEFGLEDCAKKYPSQLSGGMRQRAALLRTYLFSDKVALLDEPFSALDALTKASMHKWYLEIMEKLKLSTLFITHDIDEAIMLSDKICIMSGKPGTIKDVIDISVQRPRTPDFIVSQEFIEFKKQILQKL